ncbi:hypothetical protein OIU79_004575 [Salix purpurea]|uniref:Root meristem growth factor 8 n=1 Tax=Salix purpurea TaxID=77065 RepID=A0A9Q0Z9P1_SALPP|nr:hypothetical protein OIU79_004575 [Salix purpurea]
MAIVTALCVCLSVMLITPFAATQIQEEQSSHQQAANDKIEFSVPTLLPRKLRLVDQEVAVKSYAAQGLTSLNKPKGDSTPGKPYRREQNEVYGRRPAGKWRRWVTGTDTHHSFTMDYAPVRRRRPIHNKSLPAGP